MALISCTECGRQVSDKAATCPGCGAPIGAPAAPLADSQAQPATKPAADEEKEHVILCSDVLMVTTSRLLVGETTYAVKNITSSRIIRIPGSSAGALVGSLGALLCTAGLPYYASLDPTDSVVGPLVLLAFGTVMLFAGVSDYSRKRDAFWIGITTSGAEVRAVWFRNAAVATTVLDAINAAIAGYRTTMSWPEEPDSQLRSAPVGVLAVAIPIALALLHGFLFGIPGLFPLLLLVMTGVVAALVITQRSSLRAKPPSEYMAYLRSNKVAAGLVVAMVGVAEIAAVGLGMGPALARGRIDAALAADDPCTAVDPLDSKHATREQQEKLENKSDRCRSERYAAEKTREEKAQHSYEQSCSKLLAALRSGTMSAEDTAAAGDFAALASRIANKAITSSDARYVAPEDIPCAKSSVRAQIWEAYAAAAAASPIWGDIKSENDLHPVLFEELRSGEYKLPQASADAFQAAISPVVQASMRATSLKDMGSAKDLCDLAKALKTTGSDACAQVTSRHETTKKRLEAAEEAKKAREEAAEKARAARCEAITKQRQMCMRSCDNLLFAGQDEAALNCEDRCARQFSLPDCD